MARQRLRPSLPGIFSVIAGVAALAASRIAILGYGPVPIAILGIALGLAGFLFSAVRGRSGSGIPALGILICAGALTLACYKDGSLSKWTARFRVAPAPSSHVAQPQVRPEPTIASPPRELPHVHNIFDDDEPADADHSTPATTAKPALSAHDTSRLGNEPTGARSLPAPPQENVQRVLTVEEAKAKVDAAMTALDQVLSKDPTYQTARENAKAADRNRAQALSANGPGTPEAARASQAWIDARTALRKARDAAIAANPAAQAAQQQLAAAKADLRAAHQ
jgi:hypothetical protein